MAAKQSKEPENQEEQPIAEAVEAAQEKIINEEYKMWKKQSPFIYDLCITKALESPSTTVQWLPEHPPIGATSASKTLFSTQTLLLGTQHEVGTNFLYKGLVDLPTQETDDNEPLLNVVSEGQKIVHNGGVNKARYSKTQPDMLATLSSSGDVYIFDATTYSTDTPDGSFSPTATLKHHTQEGFGLAWNPHAAGSLVSGTQDGTIALWECGNPDRGATIAPKHIFTEQTPAYINDLAWAPTQALSHVFGSACENGSVSLYDVRASTVSLEMAQLHSAGVNSLAFHPTDINLIATGCVDSSASVWDLRYTSRPVVNLQYHEADVTYVAWSPHDSSVLATASGDRRVCLWDLSLVGESQDASESEMGPPELIFLHGGHTNRVCELDWHPVLPWVLASVSEDNIVQIWRPSGVIVDGAEADEPNVE